MNPRPNKLNQYLNWTPSVIYYDDNHPNPPPPDPPVWVYPANGVMMAEGWITASYNALNQPVAILSEAYAGTPDLMWFGHDPLGRCVKRWVGESGDIYSNPATYFHYDGWNLLQEGNNAWGPARIYAHGNRVDEIVASYNTWTGEYAYHHYDARGHCTLLTNSTGDILEQYDYDAFGFPYFYDPLGNSTASSLFGNRFLFTGREWLSDLRIYDFRYRHYQPELGRFLQPDPKQFAAGDYNLYRYCHNDPVNRSDPTGLSYVSGLTHQGGGEWIRGADGVTNRERDLMNSGDFSSFSDAANSQTTNAYNKMRGAASATEAGADIYQRNDNSQNYRIEKPRLGGIHHDINDEGEKGKYLGHEIRPDKAPQAYHVAGWLYAHPFYRPKVPAADQRRAYKNGWSAVLVTPPKWAGSPFKEQRNIQRYNYPDPPDLE